MTFPNAAKGVNKIFIAEILMLIGTIVISIGAVLMLGAAGTAVESYVTDELNEATGTAILATAAGGGLISIVSLIVMLVGEILLIVGLWQAGKDEPTYIKKAFWFAIILIVLAIVSGCLTASGNFDAAYFVQIASDVLSLLVFIFTIQGINLLAEKINRSDIASLGSKIIWILVAILIISLVLKFLSSFDIINEIGSVASSILSIVMYIAYLVYLAKAKNALNAS